MKTFAKNKKLGKNNALKLFHELCYCECYVNVYYKQFRLDDIQEEFDFTDLINYLSNLLIPYDVMLEFFNGNISYCDMNGNPQYDDHDYFVIEQDKDTHEIIDIYSWTEVAGNIYRLSEYGKTWKEGKITTVEIRERTEEEKRHFEEMMSKIIPDLINPDWDVKVNKKEE